MAYCLSRLKMIASFKAVVIICESNFAWFSRESSVHHPRSNHRNKRLQSSYPSSIKFAVNCRSFHKPLAAFSFLFAVQWEFYYVLQTGTNYWSLPINVRCLCRVFVSINLRNSINFHLSDISWHTHSTHTQMVFNNSTIVISPCKYIVWQSHQLMSSVKFIQL